MAALPPVATGHARGHEECLRAVAERNVRTGRKVACEGGELRAGRGPCGGGEAEEVEHAQNHGRILRRGSPIHIVERGDEAESVADLVGRHGLEIHLVK